MPPTPSLTPHLHELPNHNHHSTTTTTSTITTPTPTPPTHHQYYYMYTATSPPNIWYIQCVHQIFVWNCKGILWNSTQNTVTIQWKMYISSTDENLRALRLAFLKCLQHCQLHPYHKTTAPTTNTTSQHHNHAATYNSQGHNGFPSNSFWTVYRPKKHRPFWITWAAMWPYTTTNAGWSAVPTIYRTALHSAHNTIQNVFWWFRQHLKAFSWMKFLELRLIFHWGLFVMLQLTISQNWLRYWLGAEQVTRH